MASNQEVATVYAVESVAMDESALKPAKRGGATLTQVGEGGLVYLIGGANREGASFGDVHCFDFETRAWKLVSPSSGSLSPRSGHSAVAVGAKIYVFGGLDVAAGASYNDVNVFDTRTSSWCEAAVEGEAPRPRNAHAAIVLPEEDDSLETRRMLVHGGSSPKFGASDELFLLHVPVHDVDTALRWEKLSPDGEVPEARELHSALLQSESAICFAGGRNFDGKICTDMATLDIKSWTWQLVPICEWNRCSLAAGVIDGELVSFGGWDGGRICGDCCRYSDEEESWIQVTLAECKTGKQAEPAVSEVPERFGHCSTTVTIQPLNQPNANATRQGLLIFGGMNAQSDLDDLVLIMTSC
ncbi:hypothetical protein PR003_g4656 [Phytophthora rubi]|uniref:Uncharacterized protein n=1 Tax=Phytophthora rubi TaxID=129364 RepID=A0A6A3HB55_9STRA|nr:hypothetical protein PR002_g28435 [Phytophthora rubi]KAE9019308.1 hypothetical protein PR001_g13917 [Phytophthora rubi]KAE9351876.1 hypothetical protein PR003_g4656 [Phytophthora rubi]